MRYLIYFWAHYVFKIQCGFLSTYSTSPIETALLQEPSSCRWLVAMALEGQAECICLKVGSCCVQITPTSQPLKASKIYFSLKLYVSGKSGFHNPSELRLHLSPDHSYQEDKQESHVAVQGFRLEGTSTTSAPEQVTEPEMAGSAILSPVQEAEMGDTCCPTPVITTAIKRTL